MTTAPTAYPPYPYRRPSVWGAIFRFLTGTLFGVSVGVNLLLIWVIANLFSPDTEEEIRERYHAGRRTAGNKIAIVQIDGVIMEGLLDHERRQIDRAAADDDVRAVVLRINSPGGSITGSDDLFHRLCKLRDGDPDRKRDAKPLVASMGSLAASGGYYIAMPAKHVIAERTTITGSIGVYAAFPNVKELADKWGVKMEVIKRGEVKDSGSMFHDMTPHERRLWQDLIDHAYDQFLEVVREGRGEKLKHGLRDPIQVGDAADQPSHERRLADGGVFTADRAKAYGLIDQIGYLDDAIQEAAKQAGLGRDYQVVRYERPRSVLGVLTGTDATAPTPDIAAWAQGAMPRVWYLAPESGLAGFLAAGASRK